VAKGMVFSNTVGGEFQSGKEETNNNSRRTVVKPIKPKSKKRG
jgi:hypothetical protein